MSKAESSTSARRAEPSACADFRFSIKSDLGEVVPLVRRAQHFLKEHGIHERDIFAASTCLAEACNNAVLYASGPEPVEVTLEIRSGRLRIAVLDHTPGFELPATIEPPPEDAERGRGLFLIRTLMDTVEYQRNSSGNILNLLKRIDRLS